MSRIYSDGRIISREGKHKIEITDLIANTDLQKLQNFFTSFHEVDIVLVDPEGKAITRRESHSDFCKFVHYLIPEGEDCPGTLESITDHKKNYALKVYTCPGLPSLLVGIVPVYVDGSHLADWHVGPVREEEVDEGKIITRALQLGLDKDKILSEIRKIAAVSKTEFEKMLGFLELLSFQVSLIVVQKLEYKKIATQRDKVEKALRNSEQRLSLALSNSNLTLWDWNIKKGELFVSRRCAEMIEFVPDEMKSVELLKKLVHTEDLPSVASLLYTHLKGDIPFFDSEYRIKTRMDKWKWIHTRGRIAEWDEKGSPARMVGTNMDISDRKNAESLLQSKSEEQNILLDNIDVHVWYIKGSQKIGWVNSACADFLGIDQSRLQGYIIRDIYGDSAEEMIRNNEKVIKTAKVLKTEEWLKDKNGIERLFSVTRSPKIGVKGSVELIICTASDITERREYEEKLSYMAAHDPLTGVYNRHYLEDILKKEAGRSRRYNHSMEFIMVDINRFKEINDKFGHQTGDRVLAEVAAILEKEVRDSDFVVRYGGDEFLIILPETIGQSAVLKDRISVAVNEWNRSNNIINFTLTLSMGCSQWVPGSPLSIEEALAEADRMMYLEKGLPKGSANPYINFTAETGHLGTYRRITTTNTGKQN